MLGLMEVKCEINFHFLIQFREDLTGWEKAAVLNGGATEYDSWATAYPVAQHSPTHNTCITIYKKKRKICMLKFYLAEHTRASAAAARPLLNANCCLWPPASCGQCPICRLPVKCSRAGEASYSPGIQDSYLLSTLQNIKLFFPLFRIHVTCWVLYITSTVPVHCYGYNIINQCNTINFIFILFMYMLCCDCVKYWWSVFRLRFRLICMGFD